MSSTKASISPSSDLPNLWTQRTNQPFVAGIEDVNQIGPVAGAVDVLADALEYLLDLFVQLGPVGDKHHAGVGDVLANPLRQPHHG